MAVHDANVAAHVRDAAPTCDCAIIALLTASRLITSLCARQFSRASGSELQVPIELKMNDPCYLLE